MHLFRIAPDEVASAAAIDEQGVAGHDGVAQAVATRAGRVPWRVHHGHVDVLANPQRVAWRRRHQVLAAVARELDFRAQHVHRDIQGFDQLLDSVDVIKMAMRAQDVRDLQIEALRLLQDRRRVPGWVDDGAGLGRLVGQQVDEVVPRPEWQGVDGESFARHSVRCCVGHVGLGKASRR